MDFFADPISCAVATTALILSIICLIKLASEGSPEKRKRYAPITGTVFHLLLNFGRLHDYMTEIGRKHRTYRFLSFSFSQVYTADPANVEYMLKTNFANYGKGLLHYSILSDLLGDGIFTVDGEKWRHQRKTSSYEFSTKILREFSSEVFRSKAVTLSEILSECATSNQPIEVQDLFMKSTMDSVFKVVLGVDLGIVYKTNEATQSEGTLFTKAFDEANEFTLYRYVDVFWKIKRFLNFGLEAKLKNCIQVVDKFIYNVIRNKIEQLHRSPNDSHMKKDVLSRFLESNETDPKYLKDIILSFIIAGKDTTAVTLSWFLYMMCKHPFSQEKIAQEVWEKIGDLKENSSFGEIAASISEESLNKMHYLHAALTETIRLYPAVPIDGKVCFSDDTLPDGTSVRRGDQVSYVPYVMGKMKWLWGDDAEEFRPERWLNQDGVFQPESSFKFTAFQVRKY
ncbi:hypothetical protein U1Q18_026429 [Sarracenia purpurea var. burkii]